MANDTGLSCPLCLNVYDPDDMLAVAVPHARFPQSEPAKFCRPCVIVFMNSAVMSDLVDPREVFGDAQPSNNLDLVGGDSVASAEAMSPVVPEGESGPGAPALDRPEPEVPGGGEDGEPAPEKG